MDSLKISTDITQDSRSDSELGQRTSLRFPIQLPIHLIVDGMDMKAEAENFSSSGALLRVVSPMQTGTTIHFLLEVPAGLSGSDSTAAVDGEGVVVRAYQENGQNYAAIVINEYRFQ